MEHKKIENENAGALSKLNASAKEFKNGVFNSEANVDKIVHQIGEKIGSISSQAVESTNDVIKSTRNYIHKNPIRVVAVATVTGMALGSFLAFSLRRRG